MASGDCGCGDGCSAGMGVVVIIGGCSNCMGDRNIAWWFLVVVVMMVFGGFGGAVHWSSSW